MEHSDDHSHATQINKSNKNVFLIGISLNMAFVLAEVIAGFVNNSMALLTDAGHNLSDVASLAISLVAFWLAKKKSIAWIAAVGIVINSVSAFLFFRQKHELNSKAAYLHLLADALVSLGVVIAGIVISFTHLYWLDPAIGIVIMVVILFSTWGLLRDSFKMTIDAVPAGIELD